jgi:hypothetical protein
MNGYDGSLMGSINAIPEYTKYYGLSENGAASTGIIFSIFQIGQMTGALFVWVADWRGRRLSIFVGVSGVVVGRYSSSRSEQLYLTISQGPSSRARRRIFQSLLEVCITMYASQYGRELTPL